VQRGKFERAVGGDPLHPHGNRVRERGGLVFLVGATIGDPVVPAFELLADRVLTNAE
jgi:hypothetical protein